MKNLKPNKFTSTILSLLILGLLMSCNSDDDNNATMPSEVNSIQDVITDENLRDNIFVLIINPPEVERGLVFSATIDGKITKIGRSAITGDATVYRVFDVTSQTILQEVTIPSAGEANMQELTTPIPIEAGKKYVIASNNTKPFGLTRQDAQDFLPYTKNGITLEKSNSKNGPPGTFPDENDQYDIIYGVPLFVFSPN